MKAKIAALPGDGIGPEVLVEATRVLDHVAKRFSHEIELTSSLIGGAAINATGTALPDATLAACKEADAVLLGAVGGPEWDDPNAAVRPEQGLLGLRKALDLFANLRPVTIHPALAEASPVKVERLKGVDILVVRELTGGLYFGKPQFTEKTSDGERAVDTLEYTDTEVARVVRLACELAQGRRGRLTSVDKANVLETSRLWRRVTEGVAKDFPGVTLDHQLVDAAAMRLVSHPADFDVLVTENMFGDILTDEASVLAGSLGMLPSASLGTDRRGLYEPIHGSAPDIAGQGVANPIGTILSTAMLLRYSLGLVEEAECVERAVSQTLDAGLRTRDLGGEASTEDVGSAIRSRMG